MSVKLVCSRVDEQGYGIVYYNDQAYKVSNLLEGEEAEVELFSQSGKVVSLIKKSPDRVKPVCGVYHLCGGCQLQHIRYEHQLDLKQDYVKNCFKEVNLDVPVLKPIGMNDPYHYRNKLQIVFSEKKKKIVAGFYEENTHKVVNAEDCDIQDQVGNEIIKTFKQLMAKHKIKPYVEAKDEGLIKHVLVKRSQVTKEVLVVIVTRDLVFPGRNNILKDLRLKHPEITSVVQNINPRRTSVVLGNEEKVIFGKGYIEDVLLGHRFQIGSKTFYQVNPKQTEVLYQKAIELLNLSKNDVVLDAYAGVGTIGISLAKQAKEVLCVEINPDSVKNAKKNAHINQINNIDFVCEDASKYITYMVNQKVKLDAIVVDPPRSGLEKAFVDALNQIKVKKLVYISCDPKTLSRDLKQLSYKYDIHPVQPVDMFSQTYHIENVVLLTAKKQVQ